MIQSPLALAATLAGVAALGYWLERRFAWAAKVGASLLVIVLGAALSNLGLVPLASPAYDGVTGPVTSLAIAWLLLAVDLRDLRSAGPRMLGAFAVAVAATVVGAVAAYLAFGPALGGESWKLAGVMVGTYAGGSLNFVAVGRALELPESLFTAATAADNVMTAVWMGATLGLPVWLARLWPGAPAGGAERPETGSGGSHEASEEEVRERAAGLLRAPVPLRIFDLAMLLALGLALLLAAEATAERLPGVPAVIWLTTYALALAQVPAVRRLEGALQLGTLALNLFFVVIGVGSRVAEILAVGPEVFYFTATVVAVHGLVTYAAARLLRFDLETTSVASQAAIGGPSTALALAVARRRPHLALPGLVVGLLGYAVGTYAGLAVAHLLRAAG